MHDQTALSTNVVRQVGTLTKPLVGKIDAMNEAILRLNDILTTQGTTIASLERKISGLQPTNQHQNNPDMINYKAPGPLPVHTRPSKNNKPAIQEKMSNQPPRQHLPKPAGENS